MTEEAWTPGADAWWWKGIEGDPGGGGKQERSTAMGGPLPQQNSIQPISQDVTPQISVSLCSKKLGIKPL